MKRYPFGKFVLDIPDDHKILEIHRSAILYDRGYGILLEEISKASPKGVVIDIGANIGDTAAFMATFLSNKIICVEGNGPYLDYLKNNQRHLGSQVEVVGKFVRTASLSNTTLQYAGAQGTGAISVGERNALSSEDFITVDSLIALAAERLSLVKSDTDGMDGYIISEFLTKIEVPLFFECDTIAILDNVPNPWPEVFALLQKRNYSIIVFDNFGLPMLIEEHNPESILRDLAGYAHLQRAVHPIRVHYFDVWAFPQSWRGVHRTAAARLRADLLRPYAF